MTAPPRPPFSPLDPAPAPATASVRVLILARSPAVRAGLGAMLTGDPTITLSASAGIDPGWLRPTRDSGPGEAIDAIVVDLAAVGTAALDSVSERYPLVPLVLLGGDADSLPDPSGGPVAWLGGEADEGSVRAAVHGVVAGLTVIDPTLIARFRAGPVTPAPVAAAGGETLTPREREVLRLVAEGLPNKTIARELGISEHTAKFHVGSLLAKLGAGSRTEAVTTATRRGLLTV